jgi:glycosyltransferase involved in cell wall biosynthesis
MLLQNRPVIRAGQTRPIRVLHVVKELKGGGAETFVRGLARGLGGAGLDVRILSLYPDGLREAERAELGVPIRALDRRGRADVAGFYPRLIAAVRAARPDIVHAHLHAGKFAGRIAAIAAGVPNIVFTEHGDEAGGALRRAVNRVLHPLTARFVVFSESQRRPFAARERVPLERVVAIPNGVAEPPPAERAGLRAELGLAEDAFALYLPARLTTQKNQTVALAAFAAAFAGDERVRLFLAGSGPLEGALREEAAALGLGDRVRFLGFRDDAARLGRAMDAFVMPSVWERMPLALGEAMLAGLPVVTSPWEGHADFVRDGVTGIVAGDGSVAAFTRALERLRDAALRARIAGNAREFALGAFGLSACVSRHIDLYTGLTADAR